MGQASDEHGWYTVANTRQRAHQKEPAEQWLDRVLGLPPGARRSFRVDTTGDVLTRGEGGEVVRRALPASRVTVLRALVAVERGERDAGWRRNDGAGWVLCDARGEVFLLTRKDELHPNPRCRGLLACMGGSVEAGESLEQGALRELYEELRDPVFADAVAARAVSLGAPTLGAVQWPGEYRMAMWLAAAPPEVFAEWRAAWSRDDALSEAQPCVIARDELLAAIEQERSAPGSRFVASHHELLARALGHTAGAR